MMNSFLRQSTASQTRVLGPFLDDTDFRTPETALTISNTDIRISTNGAAFADKNSGGGTHMESGYYSAVFNATDTATVGEMIVHVNEAGSLPVVHKFWVLEETIYDKLFGASAAGDLGVDVIKWLGTAAATPTVAGVPEVDLTHSAGTVLATAAAGYVPGDVRRVDGVALVAHPAGVFPSTPADEFAFTVTDAVFTPTTTEFRITETPAWSTDNVPIGRPIRMTSGPNVGALTFLLAYTAATKHLTVRKLPTAPVNGNTGKIV